MCTLSWIRDANEYQLFFNRDEKLTRKQALPPRVAMCDGVRFLAPVDGDFGGTWIAANESGVSICLLNGANLTDSRGPEPSQARSRGLLLPELISSVSVAAACERVGGADLSVYAPFTLVCFGPVEATAVIEWDGSRQTSGSLDQSCCMLASSSFDTASVRTCRQKEFDRLTTSRVPAEELLLEFHSSHAPSRSAYSTCMHRTDAETVSFSRIGVTARQTEFLYSPAAPCQRVPATRLTLARNG